MIALFLSASLTIKKIKSNKKNISNKYMSINLIQWKQKTHKSENTKENTKKASVMATLNRLFVLAVGLLC